MDGASFVMSPDSIVSLYESTLSDTQCIYDYMRKLATLERQDNGAAVKCVAVHTDFQGWSTGHFQAVVDMAHELQEYGYRSLVMLNGTPPEDRCPTDLDIVVLTPLTDGESCRQRIIEVEQACQAYEIDAVIINGYASLNKYFDLLMFKRASQSRTIQCYLQFHSQFCRLQNIEIGNSWLEDNAYCINVFDALLPEGSVDCEFWSVYNPRVSFRPLPIPYDLSSIELSLLDTKTVLYLGRLDGTKNQIDAVKAFSFVHKRFPDAKLLLVGDGAEGYKTKIVRAIGEEGLEDAVVFAGYLTGEDKRNAISHAACAISTSKFEGYPIALAEQMAYGLPLVMFNIPSLTIADAGKDGGVAIVRQRDCEALANEIIALFEDDDYRRDMGLKAHQRMKDIYDFDYKAFWNDFFNGAYPQQTHDEDVLIKVYQCFFNAFSNNKLLATNLENRLANSQTALSNTKSKLAEKAAKLKDTQSKLRTTKETLKSVRSDLKATKVELKATKAELKTTKQALGTAEKTITKMKNSRSWKITKPLRKIAGHD